MFQSDDCGVKLSYGYGYGYENAAGFTVAGRAAGAACPRGSPPATCPGFPGALAVGGSTCGFDPTTSTSADLAARSRAGVQ